MVLGVDGRGAGRISTFQPGSAIPVASRRSQSAADDPHSGDGPAGRDHNITGYPMWLTGAGIKRGLTYGATDEYGQHAVEGRMHTNDLHASLLALLGLDHERLTYRYAGRDVRLTDVAGNVATEIFT